MVLMVIVINNWMNIHVIWYNDNEYNISLLMRTNLELIRHRFHYTLLRDIFKPNFKVLKVLLSSMILLVTSLNKYIFWYVVLFVKL